MCAVTGSIAPAQPVVSWQPPQPSPIAPPATTQPVATWPAGTQPGPTAAVKKPADIVKAEKRVKEAWQFLAFIACVWIVLGTVAELANVGGLLNYFDWYAVAEGAIYLVLVYFIRRGSLVALGIAVGIYALDTVALLLTGSFFIIRLFILVFLVRSVAAAYQLRQYRKQAALAASSGEQRAA